VGNGDAILAHTGVVVVESAEGKALMALMSSFHKRRRVFKGKGDLGKSTSHKWQNKRNKKKRRQEARRNHDSGGGWRPRCVGGGKKKKDSLFDLS